MKILVPTDFSKNARKAIDYAVRVAEKFASEIILVHAYDIIDTGSPTRRLLFEEYNYSIARKLHDELKAQRNRIAKINPGIKIKAELSDGGIKKGILNVSESSGADFIVMGTQGATGLKKVFMGSVTANVIGHATVPVFAIPRQYKWKQPANILLATNRFETNPEVLKLILKIVELFNARLHIIVFTDSDTAEQADYTYNEKGLKSYHDELVRKYGNIKITSAHLKGSEFEDTLQQYISDNSIDIVAMITRKRNLLQKIFNRSVTKQMAYRTQIPLLAIPGEDK